jgi:hypothetical protein
MKSKTSIQILCGLLFLVSISFGNLFVRGNSYVQNSITLSGIIKLAIADGECEDLGGAYPGKKPLTGEECYCVATGIYITPQECGESGTGCTVINPCE